MAQCLDRIIETGGICFSTVIANMKLYWIDAYYVSQKYIYVKHPFLLPVMMIDDKPWVIFTLNILLTYGLIYSTSTAEVYKQIISFRPIKSVFDFWYQLFQKLIRQYMYESCDTKYDISISIICYMKNFREGRLFHQINTIISCVFCYF